MHGGVPVTAERRQVGARGVPLVAIEAVARVLRVQLLHPPVAGHLRDDGRGGDGRAATIPSHDALLRHRQIRHLESIDDHEVGRGREGPHGPTHRGERGIVNIDPIDVPRLHRDHRPASGVDDPIVQKLATRRRQELGVPETGDGPPRVEDDGRRHHRARKATAPDLVDTRDPGEPSAP